MAERIRVGILGAGMAGKAHATAFSRLPDVEVTAFWSRTRAHAEKVAGELKLTGAQVYDDWRELVERAEVDVISVTTPPMLRRAPVEMALGRALHVLVEKPLSIELGESQEMIRLAQGAGTVTATCFNWRYSPGIQVAWREVQAGRIGRLLDIQQEGRLRISPRAWLTSWPWEPETGQGLLAAAGSHGIDRVRFLTGREYTRLVGRVVPFCLSAEREYTMDCGAFMLMVELTGDVLGHLGFTMTTGQGEWRYLVHGEGGTLDVTEEAVILRCAGEKAAVSLDIPEPDRLAYASGPHQYNWNLLIADFAAAIRRGDLAHASVPCLPTLEDGLRTQEVIVAAMMSERERRWVDIGQELRVSLG